MIKHRNTNQQVIRIFKVKDFKPTSGQNLKSYFGQDNLTLVRTLNLDLKNKNLFQERSTELFLDGITDAGQYFIVATNDDKSLMELAKDVKKWNAERIYSTQLTVSEMSITTTSANGEFTVLAINEKLESQ